MNRSFSWLILLIFLMISIIGIMFDIYLIETGTIVLIFSLGFYNMYRVFGSEREATRVFIIVFFVLLHCIFYLSLDPIAGVDSKKYYQESLSIYNDGLSGFSNSSNANVSENIWSVVFSLMAVVGAAIFYVLQMATPGLLWIINLLSIVSISNSLSKIYNLNVNTLLIVLLASPFLTYWNYSFIKDLLALALTLKSLVYFLNGSKARFLIFILLATLFRPYSVTIFISYWLFKKMNIKLTIFVLILCIFVCFLTYGLYIEKFFLMFLYMLLSPSPFNIENYISLTLFLPMIESAFSLGLIICFMINKSERTKAINLFFCIFVTVSALYLVDTIYAVTNFGDGSIIAENIYRKKLPLVPLIYVALIKIFESHYYKLRKMNSTV
ncbi:hypothetical protein [Vibrio cyclitrophicus]|uniref:hypothetical protein n=1 Tax=Vibrio cyclitrophicus TaxID=47951 RepID=UPI0002D7F46B|nr:hypothetical protein [Vibrio cyclitrophicus]OEE10477.1 hypothetical protein OC1_16705 [Vibrio cyclitrophicus ZF207]